MTRIYGENLAGGNREEKTKDGKFKGDAVRFGSVASRLTSISDQINVTGYVYDDKGRVKQVNHPVGGSTFYAYNKNDEGTRITDGNGRYRDFTYNMLGQQATEKWLDSALNVVRTITWTHDNAGLLDSATDPDSTYAYTYDVANRLTSVNNAGTPGVPATTLSYTYDEQDNRKTMTDNLSQVHTTTYDYVLNRLDKMTVANAGTVAQVKFNYDSIGRVSAIDRSIPTDSPIRTAYSYDGLDRLTQIKHTREIGTPTLLSQFNYSFDVASQIVSYTSTSPSPSPINESISYLYDKTGQLTQAQGVRNGVNFTDSYSFDRNGNRTMAGYSTIAGNRLSNDGTYSYEYDPEGNLWKRTRLSDGQYTEYTWDYRNRLTNIILKASATSPTIIREQRNTYDVFDRRIGVYEDIDGPVPTGPTPATQRWTVYDGANPYADFNGAGALQERYLYGPALDQVFARMGATENVNWYLTDNLGSVRQIADTNGAILNAVNYDSFGKALPGELNPQNGDRFRYTGRESDNLFNLLFYRARYYSFDIGRFISADPIGFGGGDANLYRYVGNSPTNASDPSGLQQGRTGWGRGTAGDILNLPCPRCGANPNACPNAGLPGPAQIGNVSPRLVGGPDVSEWFMREIAIFRREARRIRDQAREQIQAGLRMRREDATGGAFGAYLNYEVQARLVLARLALLSDYKARPEFQGTENVTLFGRVVGTNQLGNIMFGILAADLELVTRARDYGRGNPAWYMGFFGATGPDVPWTAPGEAYRETAFDIGVAFARGPGTADSLSALMNTNPSAAVDDYQRGYVPSRVIYRGPQTDLSRPPLVDPSGNIRR